MIERLETIEKRFNEITEELTNPETLSNIKLTLELNKEQASLKDAYDAFQVYKRILADIEAATEMLKDADMGEFAKEELSNLQTEKTDMEAKLEILLLKSFQLNSDSNIFNDL